jgi:menaquinol-cytochrome c reductase iron-sulfur subunit
VADSEHIDRRSFVKVILTATGGFIALIVGIPAIAYLLEPATKKQSAEVWIPAGPVDNYELNTPTLFTFTQTTQNGWERTVNSYGVYVIKHGPEDFTVYSNMCTHLACRVTWQDGEQEYVCPCHDGRFNADGAVVSGPPPAPMIRYQTKIEENILSFLFEEA